MLKVENDENEESGGFNFNSLRKAAYLLRAINNKSRQLIIVRLDIMENPTVSDLMKVLNMEQSVLSQHLGILRRARIVTSLKRGKFVYYFINKDRLADIQKFTDSIVN